MKSPEKDVTSDTKNNNVQIEGCSTNYIQTKTIHDEEPEYTKLLELESEKRPEKAVQGNVIWFLYIPINDPLVYWLEGILSNRIDEYEVARESGWRQNRFVVNKIKIIKHWGNLKPLPKTISMGTGHKDWILPCKGRRTTYEDTFRV